MPPPPKGRPRGGFNDKNRPAPPCLGEALRRGTLLTIHNASAILMIGGTLLKGVLIVWDIPKEM